MAGIPSSVVRVASSYLGLRESNSSSLTLSSCDVQNSIRRSAGEAGQEEQTNRLKILSNHVVI